MKNILRVSLAKLSAIILLLHSGAQAQTINTFAGTGATGTGGDGAAATLATFTYPHGMATDGAGNIYITDANGHTIRKVSTSGIITTIAGTGVAGYNGEGIVATAAQVNNPFAITVDAAGTIYFTEAAGARVRKIAGGMMYTIAGNGVPGFSGDGGPATASVIRYGGGIVIDNAGNILFSDNSNNRIRKINTSGIISTYAGNGSMVYSGDGVQATATAIFSPGFIAMDVAGNLFVSENGGNRVRKITPAGIISTYAGNGTATETGDGGPATAAGTRGPGGMDIDHEGNLYVMNYSNNVRKITPAGIISTFAGTGAATSTGDGGPAALATFNTPTGLMVDNCGKILIAEGNGKRVRRITFDNRAPSFTNGTVVTVNVCGTTADTIVIDSVINTLAAVRDTDLCQSEVWSLVAPAAHGTTAGFMHMMTSNGAVLTPTGLTYSPALGYVGNDTVRVRVWDGTSSDTISICISVVNCGLTEAPMAQAGAPDLMVFPNPSRGAFSVRLSGNDGAGITEVILTNIAGMRIAEFRMEEKEEKHVDLQLAPGIYLLSARNKGGATVRKVVIE